MPLGLWLCFITWGQFAQTTTWDILTSQSSYLHCWSGSHQPASLHQQITDNNSKDRSAPLYDFSTFSLKSSSTSEFKLWWETSLGCEHLISPGCTHPPTHTHTHTHRDTLTTHFIGGLWEAGLSGAWHKNYTSGSCKPANSHTLSRLWLLWESTLLAITLRAN